MVSPVPRVTKSQSGDSGIPFVRMFCSRTVVKGAHVSDLAASEFTPRGSQGECGSAKT